MRSALVSVFVFLFVASAVPAGAATVHRSRVRPHVTADSREGVTAPNPPAGTARVAVPGWSDEDTRRWLDNASSMPGGG